MARRLRLNTEDEVSLGLVERRFPFELTVMVARFEATRGFYMTREVVQVDEDMRSAGQLLQHLGLSINDYTLFIGCFSFPSDGLLVNALSFCQHGTVAQALFDVADVFTGNGKGRGLMPTFQIKGKGKGKGGKGG